MQNPSNPQSKSSESQWNILKLLRWTTDYFKSHNIESPRASAEILLAHALQTERINLYIQYDKPLSKDELAFFKTLIKRRVKKEPVAYIIGEKEFWSLSLRVTEDVLIPRPETECLVEAALSVITPLSPKKEASFSQQSHIPQRILELGTGSGAIILALATERAGHLFFASDRSVKAIQIAKENAKAHHLDPYVHFFVGNWFEPFRSNLNQFDLIISNPPYIRTDDIETLQPEICQYEPFMALDGGKEGLDAMKRIICFAPDYLAKGGILMLETGYDQKAELQKMIDACNCYEDIIFSKDYSGLDRVVQMRKK